MFYILDDKIPVKTDDILLWSENFASNRIVFKTDIGNIHISTIFLGIGCYSEQRPLLFETMIFGGKYNYHTERYSTWIEAAHGHKRAIKRILKEEE